MTMTIKEIRKSQSCPIEQTNKSSERVAYNHRLWTTRSEGNCGIFSPELFQLKPPEFPADSGKTNFTKLYYDLWIVGGAKYLCKF